MNQITFDDFINVDIRTGTIKEVHPFPNARKPSWQLLIDFGPEIGMKRSSAQLTVLYTAEDLLGKQVIAVVNFPPRQIANFFSEVLVLGLEQENGGGVVLLQPERKVENGLRMS
jgi:tRNA-binding protein